MIKSVARLLSVGILLSGLGLSLVPMPASATFPGANGNLAYELTISGNAQLRLMDPTNGQDLGEVTSTESVPDRFYDPQWSADGLQLLFTDTTDPENPWNYNAFPPALFSINGETGTYFQLTEMGQGDSTWSPDSLRIAYTGWNGDSIHVMEADGTNDHAIKTSSYGSTVFSSIQWSPKGDYLVFDTAPNWGAGAEGIAIMRPDGTGFQQLTNYGRTPSWSPDGLTIIFSSNHETGDYDEIYTMSATGQNAARLTHSAQGEMMPKISPDGTMIYYIANQTGQIRKLVPGTMQDTQVSHVVSSYIADFDWESVAPPYVYRLANWKTHERLFTTSTEEAFNARNNLEGWVLEGAAYKSAFSTTPGATPVYRMANWKTKERLFTTSAAERDYALAHYEGWVNEGTAYHSVSCGGSASPVYRMANWKSHERLFTSSHAEVTYALTHYEGWVDEGVAFCTPAQ